MKQKPKIFSIGGATFDIFIKAHDQAIVHLRTPDSRKEWFGLEYGGKVLIDEIHETFGGGASNTSIAFSRMGFDAYFVGMVGTEYGNRVLDNLKNEKVHLDFASRTNLDKTSFSTILNSFEGERTVLAYPGANHYLKVEHLPLSALATADWIFLNHLSGLDNRIPMALVQLLEKHPRIKLAWNPGHEQIKQGLKKWKPLLSHTEVLFLNKEEASLFSGIPVCPAGVKQDDPRLHGHIPTSFLPPYADDASHILCAFSQAGVKNVVITDGKNGAQATDGKRVYFCPVVSHKIVDTLGAGDAFASGFASARILGEGLKDALRYGTINAQSVISYFGAQKGLLRLKELLGKVAKSNLLVTSTALKKQK
ncbi:carbohydrate kinase family protein [Candidatus Peregrinibacteria bacterium]|nr:carbohydrate kinase family protein [Candidatus Peregrinibacteria bacterium]